jgi:FtsP/CotA-like multicopper oxidase with cupredoxin domain
VKLDIKESVAELGPGLKTKVWAYNGVVPGTPIVVTPGEELTVEAVNHLKVATSIHWHGVEVPNDQDGTMSSIEPGQSFTYHFKVPASGTFWYHSHTRPVLDQVDMGLYGAFIVKAPEDAQYSSDQTFILDDWYLGARGERLKGTARGEMERLGNIETVNGKTGEAIAPLNVKQGELHKLRFINASTAAVQTIKLSRGQFRVTHTDGHALTQPYLTDTLVLQPAERFDVEYAATGTPGSRERMESADRDLGLSIPIVYGAGTQAQMDSPFVPPAPRAFAGIASKKPDFTLVLNSQMAMSMAQDDGMGMGGMMMMDHGSGAMPMEWTINGKAFPDTDPLNVKVGQVVKVKFVNNDTQMMHKMDHPMHLHGTFFQVLSINGKAPDREIWKDTITVPAGGSVEIAFQFKNPGDWMLHCHILDHEDNGLMTIVRVKP